jgi:Rrf2 family protein
VAINWRTDYAIRLLYELAKLGPGVRDTVRHTAELANVPYDYARTIARDMVAAELLNSRRGVGGGIELARPAEEITMLDIFNAMGEPTSLSLCTQGRVCSRSATCTIHSGVWRELDDLIEDHLRNATLGEAVLEAACPSAEVV